MLTGATVAGLASAYGKTRDSLSDELGRARRAFVWGIVFLTISALPLASDTIPFIGQWQSQPAPPTDATIYALQLFARLILFLPAAWFLRFAANRHAALFRLREEYSHRYALASSVEGFKKQAEGFKEEIAAVTFEQLTVNPAHSLDTHSKAGDENPPTPLLKALLDRIQGKEKAGG